MEMSDVDLAFGAASRIESILPPADKIPVGFLADTVMDDKHNVIDNDAERKWRDLFSGLFYGTIDATKVAFIPREGIDPEMAWRHIRAIMGSFAPKHEYKIAAVAYLLSLWYEDAKWEEK
jgi:hypothetical protein